MNRGRVSAYGFRALSGLYLAADLPLKFQKPGGGGGLHGEATTAHCQDRRTEINSKGSQVAGKRTCRHSGLQFPDLEETFQPTREHPLLMP